MDRAYMSVAKRTRSGVTKNLVQLAAEIPRTAKDPASPVEINVIRMMMMMKYFLIITKVQLQIQGSV